MSLVIKRKIISASFSGTIFAILLGLFFPNPFGEELLTIFDYLFAFSIATPVYLLYSFPVILIYGVLTSLISDKVSIFISGILKRENLEGVLSGVLHIVFGLALFPFSLGAAIIFFITDRLLQKRNRNFNWLQAVKSIAIPCVDWFSCMGIVYLEGILFNG